MSIIRRKKRRQYLIVDSKLAKNRQITLKAKGLMMYLLSLPDNWELTVTELIRHTKEGKDAVTSAINELIDAKYIHKENRRNEKGQFSVNYVIVEFPEDYQEGKTRADKPQRETHSGSSETENQSESNINQAIIQQSSIKKNQSSEYQKVTFSREYQETTSSLLEFGLTRKQIEKYVIDDDTLLQKIKEKIEIIKDKIRKEKVKSNPTAYMIKTMENLINSKLVIQDKIEEEIKTNKNEEEKRKKRKKEILKEYDQKFENLKKNLKFEILEKSKQVAAEQNNLLTIQIQTFGIGNLPDNSEMEFKKIRNDILKERKLI